MTERHNERKNEVYSNPDVVLGRSGRNVHFKACEGNYTQVFDKMLDDKVISTRGLKPDAKVYAEMIFDVNTAYFERMGGYDYAKAFYEEAYRMAVKEVGGEKFILSAVMHADERNKKLSDELGRDVYHYHLHVVYVPVVDKEIKWSKRCKDPALRGTVKEVVKQVSHSKKWASEKALDEQGSTLRREDGKAVLVHSYSLLQDRFFEHMDDAGFTGFERGEKGSSAQHLSVIDYKTKQELERQTVLEEQTLKQKKNLKSLSREVEAAKQVKLTARDLDSLGKKNVFGKFEMAELAWADVRLLAYEALASRHTIADLKKEVGFERSRYAELSNRFNTLWWDTKSYREALKLAPELVTAKIREVLQMHKQKKREKQHRRDGPSL